MGNNYKIKKKLFTMSQMMQTRQKTQNERFNIREKRELNYKINKKNQQSMRDKAAAQNDVVSSDEDRSRSNNRRLNGKVTKAERQKDRVDEVYDPEKNVGVKKRFKQKYFV